MTQNSDFVAGEHREDLDAAFHQVRIVDLWCGCLGFSGRLPTPLSQSLTRALKTVDAEIAQQNGYRHHDDVANDPVRELLRRLGHTGDAANHDDPGRYQQGDAA